MEKIMKKSNR